MLNLESKSYESYIGRTFDDWDDFIDANGEIVIDRDGLKYKLEQDFVVKTNPNGSIEIMGYKKSGTTTENKPKGTMEEKRILRDKMEELMVELRKNKKWSRERAIINGDPTQWPTTTPRSLEDADIDDMRKGYNTTYNEYLRYCKRIDGDALKLRHLDDPSFDIKVYERKHMIVHKYKPQPRKKPNIKKF